MSDSTMLSLLTLYNWDSTLFDTMAIPPELDRELLVDNLVIELAEFELLYPNPDFLKKAIQRWSEKELSIWKKQYATTILDYNPIENYNRTETGSETQTRDLDKTDKETRALSGSNNQVRDLNGTNNETRNLSGSNNETRALTSTGSDNTVVDSEINKSGDDIQVDATSAYDETTTFTDREKATTTLGTKEETDSTVNVTLNGTDSGTVNTTTTDVGTDNTTTTDSGTVNNTMSDTGTVDNTSKDEGTIINARDLNMKGNIGVTTTQQMIEQERASVEFSIYDYIINSFKMRFCITVY